MKTILCWFSGTGNSYWAASALADAIGDTELISIAGSQPDQLPAAERVGFVFPVYAFGPPGIVNRFLERCRIDNSAYVFAVMTYAGKPGATAKLTRHRLARAGSHLDAVFGIRMVENYPPFGGAPSPELQSEKLALAAQRIPSIASDVRRQSRHMEKSSALLDFAGFLVNPLFLKSLPRTGRNFSADDKCNGCGICEKVCPVGNIRMTNGHPEWQDTCEQCYACFHWCPQEAIQYGRRTTGQVRYHHPGCKLSDIMQSSE